MKFEEVLPALRKYKKVKRKIWRANVWLQIFEDDSGALKNCINVIREGKSMEPAELASFDIMADDWEIAE